MSETSRQFSGSRIIIVIMPNILFFIVLAIAILLTWYFPQIPWQLLPGFSMLFPWRFTQLLIGQILLILAVMFIVWGVTSMGRKRATGGELELSKRTSTLITTGAYAYCRHPQTLGFTLAIPAFALIFDFIPLLIVTLIFTPLMLALLGYEEIELLRRFGDAYDKYRETVPFIIPRGKKTIPQ